MRDDFDLAMFRLRHDTLTVGRFIAPDFAGIGATGKSIDRAAILRQVAMSDESQTAVFDRAVRVFADVAVATSRIVDSGKRPNGEPFHVTTRVTDLFVRRGNRWRMIGSQETLVAAGR